VAEGEITRRGVGSQRNADLLNGTESLALDGRAALGEQGNVFDGRDGLALEAILAASFVLVEGFGHFFMVATPSLFGVDRREANP